MTTMTSRITRIVEALPHKAQQSLLQIAEHMAEPQSFYQRMSSQQRRELAASIVEADDEVGLSPADLETRLQSALANSGA